ncbi:MAG: nucleotidyltransferase [Thiotrichales bacterium]|nr:nucleotidyltransferase [Thiotrichales bacterium]
MHKEHTSEEIPMSKFISRPGSPFDGVLDSLLADISIRIQLSQTDYAKAVDRYEAVNSWIDRKGSPLEDRVVVFYPQGSMAIGAVIATRATSDEFDLDVVAQLDLPSWVTPQQVLDLLFKAINGETGSRYHGKVRRRTRCVTVEYADNMHIDVTPAIRRTHTPERESWIFHHRAEASEEQSFLYIANPYGFAEWFETSTPLDAHFSDAYIERATAYEQMAFAAAESEPVPTQQPVSRKSKAVIVLQLLKRWRNLCYGDRAGRRPPSILLSRLIADAANHTDSLSEELLHQARNLLAVFQAADRDGRLVHVTNPVCDEDVLTDRWPESSQCQRQFLHDLEHLILQLERLDSDCDLPGMKEILVNLFGEAPAASAVTAFGEGMGQAIQAGQSQHRPGFGGLVIPAIGLGAPAVTAGSVRTTPAHTFYGEERTKQPC